MFIFIRLLANKQEFVIHVSCAASSFSSQITDVYEVGAPHFYAISVNYLHLKSFDDSDFVFTPKKNYSTRLRENLANRIYEGFSNLENVEEKQMMGRLIFMYNCKMCIGIIKNELMCNTKQKKTLLHFTGLEYS